MSFSVSEPMLASKWNALARHDFPLLASPKYDGIRCMIIERNGTAAAVTRSMKPLPNLYARKWLEENLPVGLDGELIVRGEDFHGSSSALMSRNGKPEFCFAAFDYIDPRSNAPLSTPLSDRLESLRRVLMPFNSSHRVTVIPQLEISCLTEINALYESALADGHEGLVLRRPDGIYKPGRSTLEEGFMMKLKPCLDAEAEIVGYESEKSDFFMDERLGALRVRLDRKIEFRIGTGFNDRQRHDFWQKRHQLIGKQVRFSYQEQGMKSAPRFPVFQGIRNEDDL